MKPRSLIFPFVAFWLTPHLLAQSKFLDSLKQLQDQRNKLLAAAAGPINRNYAASLKQLLQSATQAADLDSAVKIKEELKPFEKGPVSLLELPAKESSLGAGELILGGTAFLGNSIIVDGKPCTQWLGAHAPSRIVYAIPAGINTFTAIGVAPKGIRGDWLYIIKIDGKEAFRSRALNKYSKAEVPIKVNIPPASKQIELIVDEMKDYIGDHSVWAFPTFQ